MRVVIVGLPRTGTVSLKYLLSEFNIKPCFHGFDLFYDRHIHVNGWQQLLDIYDKQRSHPFLQFESNMIDIATIDKQIIDQLQNNLQQFDACSDWPVVYYWRELASIYPNCPFIVTIRDKNEWFKSFNSMTSISLTSVIMDFVLKLLPFGMKYKKYMIKSISKVFGKNIKNLVNKQLCIQIYEKHNQSVIDYFNKENKNRLFILDLEKIKKANDKEKVKIYCQLLQFLNKSDNISIDINEQDVCKVIEGSHKNTSADMRNRMIKVVLQALLRLVLLVLLPVAILGAVMIWFWQFDIM